MSQFNRFALRHFTSIRVNGKPVVAHPQTFEIPREWSPAEYSKMKFGSDRAARKFGYELADEFFAYHHDLFTHQCVVIPAPSTVVPVAATLLAKHFMNRLNQLIVRSDRPYRPVSFSMIHRNISYNHDYHHLTKEERVNILAADQIFVNWDYLDGKTVLFVDDVRITGTHEEKLDNTLRTRASDLPSPAHWMFVTYAEYTGQDAEIEAVLNYTTIKTAADVAKLSYEPGFQATTRAIRLLLEQPKSTYDMLEIVATVKPTQLEAFYNAAISKGYHNQYFDNFKAMEEFIVRRRQLLISESITSMDYA